MEPPTPPEADASRLLDHAQSPYHQGRLEQPTCAWTERNPLCGDQIHLQLLIAGDRITEAWFEGRGCAISQASASILCEFLEGQTLVAAAELQPAELLALLGVPVSPARQRCALLGFSALLRLLRDRPRR